VISHFSETWYDQLKDLTPQTIFVHLSLEDAKALYEACNYHYDTIKTEIAPNYLTRLDQIAQRVDDAITTLGGQAFVKLSTRSPKDALSGSVNERMVMLYREALQKSDKSPNQDVIAFARATRDGARVTSGKEALGLLKMSSRIREDFMKALEFPEAFNLNITVRYWVPMNPAMEFRTFISHKKLTAISQYCYMSHFPELLQNRDTLQTRISEFFEQITERIPFENAITDIIILESTIQIIEINPFFNDTSACMFSWKDDAEVIQHGPLQFRIKESPLEDPYLALPWEWKKWLFEERGIVSEKKKEVQNEEEREESSVCVLQ